MKIHPWMGVLALSLASPIASAEVICSPQLSGDPTPDVQKQAQTNTCAYADDFANSCAYRELKYGELMGASAKSAKEWTDRVGVLFDPSAKAENAMSGALQSALQDPAFLDFYKQYLRSDPKWTADRVPDYFPPEKVRSWFYGMSYLKYADPFGALKGTLDLLSHLPNPGKVSAADRKALLETVFQKGFEHRARHSVGCAAFTVTSKMETDGMKSYGPAGDRQHFPQQDEAAMKDALAATDSATKQYQSVDGARSKLQACGPAFADTQVAYRDGDIVLPTCDVDVPMKIFADNTATLSDAKSAEILKAIEQDPCYQDAKKKGLPIERIAIATSASTLNNTKNYCKYDFQKLASDRAASIQLALRANDAFKSARFEPNDRGSNGDGTSGECAYFAKEVGASAPGAKAIDDVVGGQKKTRYFLELRKPEFSGEAGERKLEKNKYAKVTLYYADKVIPNSGQTLRRATLSSCAELKFGCR